MKNKSKILKLILKFDDMINTQIERIYFRIYSMFNELDDSQNEMYIFEVPDSEWNAILEAEGVTDDSELEIKRALLIRHVVAAAVSIAIAVIICMIIDKKRRV